MIYHRVLTIGGKQLTIGGSKLAIRPWRSSDNAGGLNAQAWFTSRITNGYFNGYDIRRVGQEASSGNIGSGRAQSYFDTGYADVAIEGIMFGDPGLSGNPFVRFVADEWEGGVSPYPEVWLNPSIGLGLWVLWYVGAPSIAETIPAYGPGQILAPGTPRYIRIEAVGRRTRSFDQNNNFTMEYVVPPHMEHSTSHGVIHDVSLRQMPSGYGGLTSTTGTSNYVMDVAPLNARFTVDRLASRVGYAVPFYYEVVFVDRSVAGFEKGTATYIPATRTVTVLSVSSSSNLDLKVNWGAGQKEMLVYATAGELAAGNRGGWIDNPVFGGTQGMLEDSWSSTPITHFSDEAPGTLGPELVRNINFSTNSDWTTSGGWAIDTTTDDANLIRPSAVVNYAPSASPFSAGYFRQVLSAPLVGGKRYRLTFQIFPMQLLATEIPVINSTLVGFGAVTVTVYSGVSTTGPISPRWGDNQFSTGATTIEFVATGPHTTIELNASAMEDVNNLGTYKLQRKINYVSLREIDYD